MQIVENYKPHAYQKDAIAFMVERATAGLFLDPGLGKTSVTLAAFQVLRKKGYVRKMLVVAPLRVIYSVWPSEVERWRQFNDLKVAILHGDRKEEILEKAKLDADVFLLNYDGLQWFFNHPFKDLGVDVLVVDESTAIKHTNTQRFRILKPYLDKFKRRYILTGSPAPNGLLDLYGQVYILDLGTSLGRTFSSYRVQYFDPGGYMNHEWFPRRDTGERIYKILKPKVLRLDGRDLLDMPPLIGVDPPNITEVELPLRAMRQYTQMETALLTQVEDEIVTAANVAAASTKCRQIANGGIYVNGPGEAKRWHHVHEAKLDAAEEIIEELQGKPALVAYEYEHDLDRLRKRFRDVPHIGGGVSAARFREIETAWNDGAVPVLLAQPQSVAHGLNLQGTGAAVIWFGLTWDLETYEQFYRRVWRQGQKDKVIVHHVVAKGTIDEVIMQSLRRKDTTQRGLLDALKTYARGKRRAA